MTNYAHITENTAFLFTEFGEVKARAWFGDAAIDALPKYVRGKHKGKPKGVIVWQKVIRGGWVRGYGEGYVENRVNQIISRKLCEMAPFDRFSEGGGYGRVIIDLEETKRREEYDRREAESALRVAREEMEHKDFLAWLETDDRLQEVA